MTVVQNWSIIGFMATSLGALVAVIFRSMVIHSGAMVEKVDGLRNEFTTALTALRNEMIARFDHLDVRLAKVETIDREVHTLALKVSAEIRQNRNSARR